MLIVSVFPAIRLAGLNFLKGKWADENTNRMQKKPKKLKDEVKSRLMGTQRGLKRPTAT